MMDSTAREAKSHRIPLPVYSGALASLMARLRTSRRRCSPLTPQATVWLECEDKYAFGVDICEIMDAVHRLGSIKHAATEVRKSYSYVWKRIKEVEAALGYNLVETHVGGAGTRRSFLTDRARKLVKDFLGLRTRISEVVMDESARRFGC